MCMLAGAAPCKYAQLGHSVCLTLPCCLKPGMPCLPVHHHLLHSRWLSAPTFQLAVGIILLGLFEAFKIKR